MHTSRLMGAVCAFVFAVLATTANAALVVPNGLSPGDKYHVIFVSSTTRDATSSDIEDYDAHVQAAADAAGIGSTIGLNDWRAVGSTTTVDAIDHLSPLFSSTTEIPIYNQNGDLVSASFNGLWDTTLDNDIAYTENNTPLATNVWTGTFSTGLASTNSELGTVGFVRLGLSTDTGSAWVDANIAGKYITGQNLYGLSSELVVPTTVPIPATSWLFGSGLLGLVGIARRKKAS